MRTSTILTSLSLLLLSCGGETPEQQPPPPDPPAPTWIPAEELAGHYRGLFPGLDGQERETSLEVRVDGTYILLERHPVEDSIPRGRIGEWAPVLGGFQLDELRAGLNLRWLVERGGLRLDLREADPEAILPKVDVGRSDGTPTMRIVGNYRWKNDLQTFQPCGADPAWPMGVAAGAQVPDLLALYRAARRPPGDPLMMIVVGRLAHAPAMEGDEPEEYFFIHHLIEVMETGHCR